MFAIKKIKILFIVILVLFAALIGSCKQKANPLEEYGNVLIDSYKKSKKAGEEANLKNIQTAIQIYRATNDEYPKTLKDIEDFMGSPIDTELYEYNPENGELRLKSE